MPTGRINAPNRICREPVILAFLDRTRTMLPAGRTRSREDSSTRPQAVPIGALSMRAANASTMVRIAGKRRDVHAVRPPRLGVGARRGAARMVRAAVRDRGGGRSVRLA